MGARDISCRAAFGRDTEPAAGVSGDVCVDFSGAGGRGAQVGRKAVRPWSPPRAGRERSGARAGAGADTVGFATGDKVVHAKFGEGVVLGVEPGGIVRVFFSESGDQKRLLLEYAPLKRL